MRPKLAERLSGLVRDAVRGGTQDLAARLSDAEFSPSLCRLIPLALWLTLLGREAPADASGDTDLPEGIGQLGAEDFDGATAALLYNMLNRVSSGFALSPEWSTWRRPAWLFRLTRRPAAWMLRQSMAFGNSPPRSDAGESARKLDAQLVAGGLGPLPDDRQQLAKAPHLTEALCSLLAASAGAAELGHATLRAIDGAVLQQLQADCLGAPCDADHDVTRSSHQLPKDGPLEVCRRFAVRLTVRPWSITEEDIGRLRACGLSERELLDVVLRVAVLNGLGRLERLLRAGPGNRNGKGESGTSNPSIDF